MLPEIKEIFKSNKVFYTAHAKEEMRSEEFGVITENEVFKAIQVGKLIEEYPDDHPYPSILIFGRTAKNRPIHIVCAYSESEHLAIIVTAYEPDPYRWIDFERRKE